MSGGQRRLRPVGRKLLAYRKKAQARAFWERAISRECVDSAVGMRTRQPVFGWILSRCVVYASCTQKPQAESRNLRQHRFNHCTVRYGLPRAALGGLALWIGPRTSSCRGRRAWQDASGHRTGGNVKPATRLTCLARLVVRVDYPIIL